MPAIISKITNTFSISPGKENVQALKAWLGLEVAIASLFCPKV